jgi:hypothetical protein
MVHPAGCAVLPREVRELNDQLSARNKMTPHYQDSRLTIYQGDALEVLRTLPPESVQCVVTSPPYDNLRTYGDGPQFTFQTFCGVACESFSVFSSPAVFAAGTWADQVIGGSESLTSFRQRAVLCG